MSDDNAAEGISFGFHFREFGMVYYLSIICVIGFILNFINIVVFSHKQFAGSSTYILMIALSATDAMTFLFRAPIGLTSCFTLDWCKNWSGRVYLYIYHMSMELPITNMTENLSVWITMTLGVERYIALSYYNISKTVCTPKNTRLLIVLIAAVAIVLNLPFFFLMTFQLVPITNGTDSETQIELVTNSTQFQQSNFYMVYTFIRFFIVQIIPLIFLCVFNCLLLRLVFEHNKKFKLLYAKKIKAMELINSNSEINDIRARGRSHSTDQQDDAYIRKHRAQVKLTTLLVAIIFLYLCGQIPQALAYQKIFVYFTNCKELSNCEVYIIYYTVTVLLGLTSYCGNFFLYVTLNTHYRAVFKKLFCPRQQENAPVNEQQQPLHGKSKVLANDGYLAVPN